MLDLGCGTGGHALLLAERGYDVVGVDRSESMLEQARGKAALLTGERQPLLEHAIFGASSSARGSTPF